MLTYLIGNQTTVTAMLTNLAGVLTDDATMAVVVEDPTGAQTTPSVTHVSTGVYSVVVALTIAGIWRIRFSSTVTISATETSIYCKPSDL